MRINTILILLIGLFTSPIMTGQVEIIPGKGIVFKIDSIIIRKCVPEELSKILNLKDTVEANHVSISEYEPNGNFVSDFYIKSIFFEGFEFQFSGYKRHEMKLNNIYIELAKSSQSFYISNTKLADIDVAKKYRKSVRKEMDSSDTATLSEWSQNGITFLLDASNKAILKICVHQKEYK